MSMNLKVPKMKGSYTNINQDYGSGIKLSNIKSTGVKETIKNFNGLFNIVTIRYARALAVVGIDLLSRSVPRAPIDTGELRRSARAVLSISGKPFLVGTGRADGGVDANLGIVTKAGFGRNAKTLNLDVSYHRLNSKGTFDVAQWTHEALNQYGSASPSARTPNTGPKYLEIPWLERKRKYELFLKKVVSNKELNKDIALASKVKQKRTGKYDVNITKLVARGIQRKGYGL